MTTPVLVFKNARIFLDGEDVTARWAGALLPAVVFVEDCDGAAYISLVDPHSGRTIPNHFGTMEHSFEVLATYMATTDLLSACREILSVSALEIYRLARLAADDFAAWGWG